jgi:hypothetical protein
MKLPTLLSHFFSKKQKLAGAQDEQVSTLLSGEAQLIKERIEKRKLKQRKLKIVIGSLLSLVVIFASIAFYSQYKLRTLTQEELGVDVRASTPRTGEEIIQALSRHVLLPEGVPQIAEVQDVARLKTSQAFFENAENGDVVIVYDATIFLYRPSKDIVIATGDISSLR